MQLHRNGIFGAVFGENADSRHSECQYCFSGVYGESKYINVHTVGYNLSISDCKEIVVDYELVDGSLAPSVVNLTNTTSSIYLYTNMTEIYTNETIEDRVILVPEDSKNDSSFYTLLSYYQVVDGSASGYWRQQPYKKNQLPYLDQPNCDSDTQIWDDLL